MSLPTMGVARPKSPLAVIPPGERRRPFQSSYLREVPASQVQIPRVSLVRPHRPPRHAGRRGLRGPSSRPDVFGIRLTEHCAG